MSGRLLSSGVVDHPVAHWAAFGTGAGWVQMEPQLPLGGFVPRQICRAPVHFGGLRGPTGATVPLVPGRRVAAPALADAVRFTSVAPCPTPLAAVGNETDALNTGVFPSSIIPL